MMKRFISIGLVWGTFAVTAGAATVSGTVSYSGRQTGTI
jgi:hypothetical protein